MPWTAVLLLPAPLWIIVAFHSLIALNAKSHGVSVQILEDALVFIYPGPWLVVVYSQRAVEHSQHAAAPQGDPQGHRGGARPRTRRPAVQRPHLGPGRMVLWRAHIKIYSTGGNPEFGAKLIRKFIQRHRDHQGGKP